MCATNGAPNLGAMTACPRPWGLSRMPRLDALPPAIKREELHGTPMLISVAGRAQMRSPSSSARAGARRRRDAARCSLRVRPFLRVLECQRRSSQLADVAGVVERGRYPASPFPDGADQ